MLIVADFFLHTRVFIGALYHGCMASGNDFFHRLSALGASRQGFFIQALKNFESLSACLTAFSRLYRFVFVDRHGAQYPKECIRFPRKRDSPYLNENFLFVKLELSAIWSSAALK
jgi:hypothetical protein